MLMRLGRRGEAGLSSSKMVLGAVEQLHEPRRSTKLFERLPARNRG